ncbi:UrcA family protein [Sphingopyxis indica]|uniref:UrcA family protein n=1 Tax=Sphingopyxis indica TaxID=436663 RepID=A0A239HHV7_9SPHN|nr:UrcA family protein [Sphingopyxis indica]SNS80996.1 UrcA family protein [Sphingopyxis indica]
MQKLPILAALTALALGQPALAQDAPPTRTAVVDHRDLDLSTDKGARALDRRIWRAVVEVCGTAPDYDLEGKNQVRECRRDTRRLAAADAELAIAEAKQGQPIRVTTRAK